MGDGENYHPGFSVICCYGVLACISGSAENHIPLKRWLQGCLSCGVMVGIRVFLFGAAGVFQVTLLHGLGPYHSGSGESICFIEQRVMVQLF
jgi:hypothetical protein